MSENQCLIAEFEKNSVEKVKVHVRRWKGQAYVDVRVFFIDEEGVEHATKKGVCLNAELLPELKTAVDRALGMLELGETEEPGLGPEETQDEEVKG